MFKLANVIGYGLLSLLAIGLLCLAGWAGSTYQHRRAVKAAEATVQAHATRAAGEPAHRSNFDSLFFTRAGESRELKRTLAKIKHLDDSLNHRLPAAPALPADPARQ